MLMKILLLLISFSCFANLKIIATTANLESLAKTIGGDKVEVTGLCKGAQDPHFLEAKPSYIFKLSKADLLISVGADLEIGWLPLVIQGSRRPSLRIGEKKHLVSADAINLIEKITGGITRAQGDVHPAGNPHFMISPIESVNVARVIAQKLSLLDPSNKVYYEKNLNDYRDLINKKMIEWKKEIGVGLKVVTYHRTLSYFYRDFGITNVDVLEPKPGVPPSASHIIQLIKKMKEKNVEKIIVENYFNDAVALRIKKDIPGVSISVVPVAVGGREGINSLVELYSFLVKSMRN